MTSLGPIKREDLNDFIVSSSITVQYGFITGFLLGGYAAGQRASLQFLAENQHEAPRNRAQALQYHRNKNYKMMAAFVSGGMRRGIQLGAVAVAYSIIKKGLEGGRFREIKGLVQLNGYFDDFIAGSLVGSSFFLVSSTQIYSYL